MPPPTEISLKRAKRDRSLEPTVAAANCFLCNPQLRDPLTIALGFMKNPAMFRVCCHFTRNVWDQAVYLEGELPCAFGELTPTPDGGSDDVTVRTVPLPLHPKPNFFNEIPVSAVVLRNNTQLTELKSNLLVDTSSFRGAISFIHLPNLRRIDHDFIDRASLTKVVFQNLPALTEVGRSWVCACTSLKTAVFQDLPELTQVDNCWLHRCTSLESVTIRNLPKLVKVGDSFLYHCSSLQTVVFQDLPELTEVGSWMSNCDSLESITINNLPRLTTVASSFLNECRGLKTAVFQDLPELTEVGKCWMYLSRALESFTLRNLPKLNKTLKKTTQTC